MLNFWDVPIMFSDTNSLPLKIGGWEIAIFGVKVQFLRRELWVLTNQFCDFNTYWIKIWHDIIRDVKKQIL